MHMKAKIVALLSWLPLIPVAESSFANPHDLRYVLFSCGKLVSVALAKICLGGSLQRRGGSSWL